MVNITNLRTLINIYEKSEWKDATITFGKHRGKKVKDIPKDYIDWAKKEVEKPDITKKYRASEIKRDKKTKHLTPEDIYVHYVSEASFDPFVDRAGIDVEFGLVLAQARGGMD